MSSIGSSPGINSGTHIEVSAVRPVNGGEAQITAANSTPTPTTTAASPAHSNAAASMVSATALDAGHVPVDGERVSQIKKAIQTGSYPILPTKISDAMIAAGIMLQVRKSA